MNLLDLFASFNVGAWFSTEDRVTSVHPAPGVRNTKEKAARRGNAVFSTALTLGVAVSASTGEIATNAHVAEPFLLDQTCRLDESHLGRDFAVRMHGLSASLRAGRPLTVSAATLALAQAAVERPIDFRATSVEAWATALVESEKPSA